MFLLWYGFWESCWEVRTARWPTKSKKTKQAELKPEEERVGPVWHWGKGEAQLSVDSTAPMSSRGVGVGF